MTIQTLDKLKNIVEQPTKNGHNGQSIEATTLTELEQTETEYEKKERSERLQFYYLKENYVKGEYVGASVILKETRFLETLRYLGFKRYDFSATKSAMVQVKNNIVEEVNQIRIIDTFMNYVQEEIEEIILTANRFEVKREQLEDKIIRAIPTFFSESMLFRLYDKVESFEFNTDKIDRSYFYYTNGYVRVTKEGYELLDYKYLKRKIWRNQILPRKFKPVEVKKANTCTWGQFVNYVAGNYPNEHGKPNDPKRADDLRCIMGYLMHRYFSGKLKMVLFTDSKESDDLQARGRSGKSLIMEAIGWMLNTDEESGVAINIDGKELQLDYNHKWQDIKIRTKFVHIEDVKRNFSVESLFNTVLKGFLVQKKNEKPFTAQTKIGITSNLTIKVQGDSAKDRTEVFQTSTYFSSERSPLSVFKEWFGRDWDTLKWNDFDNFMVESVRMYLHDGLPKVRNFNLEQRYYVEQTSREFVEFMTDVVEDGKECLKKVLLAEFLDAYSDLAVGPKKLTLNKFTLWLNAFQEYNPEWSVTETRDRGIKDYKIVFKKRNYL